MRDLTNIAVAAKRRISTRNDLNMCVDNLRNLYSCNVDICTSEENEFCGIFVQDMDMRATFAAFPEILFVDATYKLLEHNPQSISLLVRTQMAQQKLLAWVC